MSDNQTDWERVALIIVLGLIGCVVAWKNPDGLILFLFIVWMIL